MPRVRRCRYNGCHAMCELPLHYCKQHAEHEQEYLESRMKWARSHNKQYQHKYNTRVRNRDTSSQERYQFYRSKQWQALRKQALERDHYLCQYCLANRLVNAGKTVDHIVAIEIDPSLRDSLGNLATICRDCHRVKTELEQKLFGTGKDNSLIDREPISKVSEWAKMIEDFQNGKQIL